MKTIRIWNDDPSDKQVEQIAERLADGEIWILPTDSIYGIMCDAFNSKAIDRICRLKNINPEKNNLSIICSSISMASEYAKIADRTFEMMKNNTPGSYTFLCKSQSTLPKEFKKRKTVGIRIPDCKTILMIAESLGHPVMTTSIEYEDEDYARNPELIAESYEGKVDGMAQGEEGGTIPTTIVDCTENTPQILREGLEGIEQP